MQTRAPPVIFATKFISSNDTREIIVVAGWEYGEGMTPCAAIDSGFVNRNNDSAFSTFRISIKLPGPAWGIV